MWNSLSHHLNHLPHHVVSSPVFHGSRLTGACVALGGLIIWLVTNHWSINVRLQMMGRIAGWLALVGLALWIVGWVVGTFVVVLLLAAAILAVALLVG